MSTVESLSGKERKEIIEKTKKFVFDPGDLLPKKGQTSRYVNEKGEAGIVANNSELIFIEKDGYTIPSLKIARNVKLVLPKVVVDVGAIRFVTNGADIMRPGIVEIDENVLEGELVVVTEEKNDAPLCFGIALYDAIDMETMENGKVIKNLHYLSDEWWEFST